MSEQHPPSSIVRIAFILLGMAGAAPGAVLAHGGAGEHVEAYETHLDDYRADVEELSQKVREIVQRYRAQGEAKEGVEALLEAWKEAKLHAVVEEVATPLYSPIWVAITEFRQAVEAEEPAEVVHERGHQLQAALHQGFGGVKLRASLEDAGQEQHASGMDPGVEATFQRIREHLDDAVAAYEGGQVDQAQSLIQEAYFQEFEGVEGGLIEQDPQLVTRLEEAFNAELPGLILEGAPTEDVEAKVESMKGALAESEELLRGSGEKSSEVF